MLARHSKPALPIVQREKQQSKFPKHCIPSKASKVELLTSTSNENLSPIFCIQIEQCFASQETAVQSKGTCITVQTFHSGSVRHVNSSLLQINFGATMLCPIACSKAHARTYRQTDRAGTRLVSNTRSQTGLTAPLHAFTHRKGQKTNACPYVWRVAQYACTMHWVAGPGNMPVRPVSSSMVKRHSKGGSLAELGMSSKARAAATPMPLSAPSVVPSACSYF